MAIMVSLLTLGIARPSTGTSRTDTASPTTSQTSASPTGSCDGYWASGRRECHWSGPPGGRQCDTGDYWLTPCAGCSRAPAGVAPVGWTPPAPHQLALDQRCLVQRLEGLERNLDIYDDFQKVCFLMVTFLLMCLGGKPAVRWEGFRRPLKCEFYRIKYS